MSSNNLPDQKTTSASSESDFTSLNLTGRESKFLADEKTQLESRVLSGANWFFWIAALSMINSVILLMNGSWSFLAGLGITQVIDALAYQVSFDAGAVATIFALILDMTVAGVFIVFGLQARKQHRWAFIAGMIVYALDGLIFLFVQDWLSIGFHVFALYCIYQGLSYSNAIIQLEQPAYDTGKAA